MRNIFVLKGVCLLKLPAITVATAVAATAMTYTSSIADSSSKHALLHNIISCETLLSIMAQISYRDISNATAIAAAIM